MDFEQLRSALEPAEPFPLPPTLPRELVLLTHTRSLEREAEFDRLGEVRTRRVVVGPGKHWSSKRLEELKVVGLGVNEGLSCNAVAKGKQLRTRCYIGAES